MKNEISKKMRQYYYLQSEIDAVYHEAAVKMGLSDSVSIILYTLCDCDGSCPLSNIGKLSGLRPQTINSAIHKMEKDDIIKIEAIDGKSKKISLTENGKRLAEKTVYKVIEIEDSIYAKWPKEFDQYIETTNRFLIELKTKVNDL